MSAEDRYPRLVSVDGEVPLTGRLADACNKAEAITLAVDPETHVPALRFLAEVPVDLAFVGSDGVPVTTLAVVVPAPPGGLPLDVEETVIEAITTALRDAQAIQTAVGGN